MRLRCSCEIGPISLIGLVKSVVANQGRLALLATNLACGPTFYLRAHEKGVVGYIHALVFWLPFEEEQLREAMLVVGKKYSTTNWA